MNPITPSDSRVPELLRTVRLLELAARRNVAGLLAGDYLTSIPGRGMQFHESRKYVPGEPARRIDWNVTARVGEPYIKVHLEERQRDVFVIVDVSPSMHTGFQERTKLEYAVELAATLAVATSDGGDRLAHILYADRVLAECRPRSGRDQLFRTLRALLENTAPWSRPVQESDPRAPLQAVEAHRGRRFVLFLISDFVDHDIPEDLKYARARHDISLLHVYDPLEYEATREVRFSAYSPEGLADVAVLRPGQTGSLVEMQRFLRAVAARHRIATASFPTTDPVASALSRFFHFKRRQVTR